ncbi:hypothetical protein [Mucilaginibacter sp. BT774]|uniref:hypothetical protein n=1 Tax=Mucilaginibacter sp. BT774 TaxID=3062276 RepID=UPI002676A802|nr:hypothetical protein [Mucilaginibacter sp. BT774]MDO3628228.1 hypothetical protein [Mucilaginibacter sp. BT774]
MKKIKIFLVLLICLAGMSTQSFAQITLPEVVIRAVKYKYLDAVDYKGAPQPVKVLQATAATYNVKTSEYYNDDYEGYFVTFYIPNGKVLAAYDANGKLLRTAEKYTNVQLPKAVTSAIATRFPKWAITKDVYKVQFYNSKGEAKKRYKLLLENGDQRVKVNINEKGEFQD